MEMNELRNEINNLDKELVELLEKRFNLVIEIGKYKKNNNIPIFDENREKIVISNCKKQLQNKNYAQNLEKVYIQIINTCKDIQKYEK